MVSPGSSRSETPSSRSRSAGSASGWRKCTASNSSSPCSSAVAGESGEAMAFSVSITSACRSMAVLAVKVMPSSMPTPSTGPLSTAAVAKKAASAPTLTPVVSSLATCQRPMNRQSPSTVSGRMTMTMLNSAWVRALRTSVPRSFSASVAKLFSAWCPRPKALSTRMPWTDSSTCVATSPAWSWARRE